MSILISRPSGRGQFGGGGMGSALGRGFTLIELMIVVAVIAILAAIAYPSYQEQVRKSRRGQAQADMVEIAQLAERFHTVNNTFVGFPGTLPAGFLVSPRGGGAAYYGIAITEVGASTFLLTATPIPPQDADRCGAMTLSATGAKTHASGTDAECKFGTLQTP